MTVDGSLVSSIGKGVLVFAGIGKDDTDKDVESMASKVLKMKMWDDEKGGRVRKPLRSTIPWLTLEQWKHSVQDVKGEILCGTVHSIYPQIGSADTVSVSIYASRNDKEGK